MHDPPAAALVPCCEAVAERLRWSGAAGRKPASSSIHLEAASNQPSRVRWAACGVSRERAPAIGTTTRVKIVTRTHTRRERGMRGMVISPFRARRNRYGSSRLLANSRPAKETLYLEECTIPRKRDKIR